MRESDKGGVQIDKDERGEVGEKKSTTRLVEVWV